MTLDLKTSLANWFYSVRQICNPKACALFNMILLSIKSPNKLFLNKYCFAFSNDFTLKVILCTSLILVLMKWNSSPLLADHI